MTHLALELVEVGMSVVHVAADVVLRRVSLRTTRELAVEASVLHWLLLPVRQGRWSVNRILREVLCCFHYGEKTYQAIQTSYSSNYGRQEIKKIKTDEKTTDTTAKPRLCVSTPSCPLLLVLPLSLSPTSSSASLSGNPCLPYLSISSPDTTTYVKSRSIFRPGIPESRFRIRSKHCL